MNKKYLSSISSLLSFSFLKKQNTLAYTAIFYHSVGEHDSNKFFNGLYAIPTKQAFIADLDFILRHYTPIDLQTLINHIQNSEPIPKNSLFLSFDDGLVSCYDTIVPILKQKGVPATFFINTGFVGKAPVFHRYSLNFLAQTLASERSPAFNEIEEIAGRKFSDTKELVLWLKSLNYTHKREITALQELISSDDFKRVYMDKSELQSLLNDGFTLGAHSIDHPEFYEISEEEQLQQATESIISLVDMFNLDYRVFAFPFTDVGVSKNFFERLDKSCSPDLTFGTSGLKKDTIPDNIQRIPMDDTGLNAKNRLKSELFYHLIKAPIRKNIYYR